MLIWPYLQCSASQQIKQRSHYKYLFLSFLLLITKTQLNNNFSLKKRMNLKTKDYQLKIQRKQSITKYNQYKQLIEELDKQTKSITTYSQVIKQIVQFTDTQLNKIGFAFMLSISMEKCKEQNVNKTYYLLDKLVFLIEILVKENMQNMTKFLNTLLNVCSLIDQYIKKTFSFLLVLRGESNLKKGHSSLDPVNQALSIINKLLLAKSIQIPHPIIDQRSKKFISVSEQLSQTIQHIWSNNQSSATNKQRFLKSSSILLQMVPRNIFQQMALNHFKYILQKTFNKNNKNHLIHCCAIFIGKSQAYMKTQTVHHEHKNYHWPINLATIVKHVKKTIVGFLNQDGGIIYVGMKQNPNDILPSGISLTKDQVVAFFEWVHTLYEHIYPQFPEIEKATMEKIYRKNLAKLKNRQENEQQSQYIINKYVAVEYLSIIDESTYLDYYDESNDSYKKFYLIRIKIKPGTKAETYHLLKQQKQGQIQCFKRKDASVNKLSLDQFFQLFKQRMMEYMNEDVNKDNVEHGCPNKHFDF